jgi:hypothetical protein
MLPHSTSNFFKLIKRTISSCKESPSRVKLQVDHAGHCEVVVPGTGPDTETMSSGGSTTRPGPTEQPTTPARAGPPDNFETPPPEALRLNKLEDFQAKQKIIEEQNR